MKTEFKKVKILHSISTCLCKIKEKFAFLGKRGTIIMTAIVIVVLGIWAYRVYIDDIAHWEDRVYTGALWEIIEEESPIASDPNRDYGESGFQQVAENEKYVLFADFTTGGISIQEKLTDKTWYSNPIDSDQDQLVGDSTMLKSQLILSYLDVKTGAAYSVNSYRGSVLLGGMDYELIDDGVKFTFAFPGQGIIVPVQYSLSEDGFLAEILFDGIEEVWCENYLLENMAFLPYFGAGGLADEGYLFLPDGSGALVEFNNGKQKYTSYTGVVYGNDLTLDGNSSNTITESILMPVFGLKCNNNGFLAVINNGESNARILASVSGKSDSYNTVYSEIDYRRYSIHEFSLAAAQGDSAGIDNTEVLLKGENYSIKYMFLESELSDYNGMSQKYKEYLTEQDLLKQSELVNESYLILDVYGAVTLEKIILGVNVPVITAMTTYKDVCNIVKELKGQGIENIIINYIGALDGGFENKLLDELSVENCLGTKKDFNEMIDYLKQEDVLFFIETNPIYIYKNGSGYAVNRDGAQTFYAKYAFQYDYTLNEKEPIIEERWHLLTPRLVPELVTDFAESAASKDISNISLYGLGKYVYSDMRKGNNYAARTESVDFWKAALNEAAKNTDYLMVHGGNDYCLSYADIVTDVPSGHSKYDIMDQSIPFYQMTLHGYVATGTTALNTTTDYRYAFLKALESGSSLKFNLLYSDVTELINTEYNDMVSYSYTRWKDVIIEYYHEMQKISEALKGQTMVAYRQLSEDVSLTVYDSGKGVIVNYTEKPYQYQDCVIEGRGYLLVEGVK